MIKNNNNHKKIIIRLANLVQISLSFVESRSNMFANKT